LNKFKFKFHPCFFDDLDQLSKRDLQAVNKKIRNIKENPLRFKRLRGKENCFSVRTGKLRIIYYAEGKIIWFLLVDRRDGVYDKYYKRLYKIKIELE